MNRNRHYEDYYQRQVGGALPVFARVQRGHGLGSMFGGLLNVIVYGEFEAFWRLIAVGTLCTIADGYVPDRTRPFGRRRR